ncbi:MAG: hypothetical protein ACRYGM_23220 [Janthinobacterium lividum]
MDPTQLPFDPDRMLADLRPWVECESPTHDAAAVNRMMDLASHDLAIGGATVERTPDPMGYGACVCASFRHSRAGEPGDPSHAGVRFDVTHAVTRPVWDPIRALSRSTRRTKRW